ncbi:MAG: NADH-quinone oxidoreductase subunit J [Acidimicrobiales bacterium]|nr:NADH-quinone oxidoreductase subunit J [Acidimicrobiales bacterium]
MDPALFLAATSKVDAATFILGAIVILGGAMGVVVARNPVHAALLLVQTLFGVAVLFVAQGAHFLAAVQVIVYAGAIVVLFLFVIMLLGVDKDEAVEAETLKSQPVVAMIVVAITAAELIFLARGNWATGAKSVVGALEGPSGNVEQLAEVIFTRYLFAFEATSVLLVIAVVAAVALARRPEGGDIDADYIAEIEAAEAAEAEAKAATPEPAADAPTAEAAESEESASQEVGS